MYGPVRQWNRDPPGRVMPPARYGRARSRSPIREPKDRYPYPEPPLTTPFRVQPKLSYRGERPEIDNVPRFHREGFDMLDRRMSFLNYPDADYRNLGRSVPDRCPPVGGRELSPPRFLQRPEYERRSPRYDRPYTDERPDLRPRGFAGRDDEYFMGEGKRNGYQSDRRPGPIDEPRFYPRDDYPPFERSKEFGQRAPVVPPRRRSPEPRYGYMPPKPPYPPRGGWPRGPSPNRWR